MRRLQLCGLIGASVSLHVCSPDPRANGHHPAANDQQSGANGQQARADDPEPPYTYRDPTPTRDEIAAANKERHHVRGRPPTEGFPEIGACYRARIETVSGRVAPGPSDRDGSQAGFDNGVLQVSYGLTPQIARSRRGDWATMCVVALPTNCPPGDFRGVWYQTRNRRTGETWVMPDSHHLCGGA